MVCQIIIVTECRKNMAERETVYMCCKSGQLVKQSINRPYQGTVRLGTEPYDRRKIVEEKSVITRP